MNDKNERIMAYTRESIIRKKVGFNRKNDIDVAILEWLDGIDEPKATYIKHLILQDMQTRTGKHE